MDKWYVELTKLTFEKNKRNSILYQYEVPFV